MRYLFLKFHFKTEYQVARTTDTQCRHKSKISEKFGRCGKQNMLPPYLKNWDWDWIFGRAVKAISSLGVRSPCQVECHGPVLFVKTFCRTYLSTIISEVAFLMSDEVRMYLWNHWFSKIPPKKFDRFLPWKVIQTRLSMHSPE